MLVEEIQERKFTIAVNPMIIWLRNARNYPLSGIGWEDDPSPADLGSQAGKNRVHGGALGHTGGGYQEEKPVDPELRPQQRDLGCFDLFVYGPKQGKEALQNNHTRDTNIFWPNSLPYEYWLDQKIL